MKKRLFIILFISIINFLSIINLISSEEINLFYNQNINVGEEFTVSLTLINFSQDIYDIKFDIKNGTKYITKTFWGGEWKANRWINDAINLSEKNTETFKLNITESYQGINNLTVKIRDSAGSSADFEFFYPITINLKTENTSNLSNSSSNSSNNSFSNSNSSPQPKIYYEIDWDEDDIVNGEEFKIEVKMFNLKDKIYDVKIWIEPGEIINERYDEKNKEWKSGFYYISNFSKGPGNITEKIKLRIKNENKDFYGPAEIFFKIRDESEIKEEITILKKSNSSNYNISSNSNETNNQNSSNNTESYTASNTAPGITSNAIKLGYKKNIQIENIKTPNKVVYESKTELIKKYSIYWFAFLCVILTILIVWGKLN